MRSDRLAAVVALLAAEFIALGEQALALVPAEKSALAILERTLASDKHGNRRLQSGEYMGKLALRQPAMRPGHSPQLGLWRVAATQVVRRARRARVAMLRSWWSMVTVNRLL